MSLSTILNKDSINKDDYCLISYQPLQDNDIFNPIIKLLCGHKFYYKNILKSYKISNIKNRYKLRICPYCTNYGGFLPTIGNAFIKDIHLEEQKICSAILSTGKNKGGICGKKGIISKKINDKYYYYCLRHKNILKNNE